MSDVKYKPYVKFYFTDPTTDIASIEEVYSGNGNVSFVECNLAAFFGDTVTTGFGQTAYFDCDVAQRDITANLVGLRASISNPIGFVWVRVLDKNDLFQQGISYFDFAGVIRRATLHKRDEDDVYRLYFEVSRTRNRDYFDLRKSFPDPFDYI